MPTKPRKPKHPTSEPISNDGTLKAVVTLWNGHTWRIRIESHDDHWDDEDFPDDISIGDASDPEEALHQAATELEDLAAALRERAKGLNDKVKAFERKQAAR